MKPITKKSGVGFSKTERPTFLGWVSALAATALLSGCAQLPNPDRNQAQPTPVTTDTVEPEPHRLPIDQAPVLKAQQTLSIETLETLTLQGLYRLQSFDQPAQVREQYYVFSDPRPVYDDLWDTIGDHLFLTPANTHNFEDYIASYLRKKPYLNRFSQRAKPYLYFILSEIQKRQMPYEMALLPIVESGFYPYARSYMSAAGLWQFMPATGYMFGLNRNWWYDGRHDVYRSTLAALDYLQSLYKQNNYDWLLALASYNAGYGNVRKATRKLKRKHPQAEANFWNLQPYLPRETRHYVPQLLAISHLISQHERYQIPLEPIANKPMITTVDINHQVSLKKVAQTTDLSADRIKNLNPGFLRQATPPNGLHKLVLPLEVAQTFKTAYQKQPRQYAVSWRRHQIRSGESLSVIAARYNTRVSQIKQLNNMRSDFIRAGHTLLIPIPGGPDAGTQLASNDRGDGQTPHRHTIRHGESLWVIAQRYNTTTGQIARWNGLSQTAVLQPGQTLKIYLEDNARKISYTVKEGESLWLVARKYQVTTDQLCEWNGIRANDILRPGTQLQVWIQS